MDKIYQVDMFFMQLIICIEANATVGIVKSYISSESGEKLDFSIICSFY